MFNGNLIGGEWSRGGHGISINISPSDTGDVIGEYAFADANDVSQAIEAASQAFPAWSRSSPELRSDILDRIGSEILARQGELGRILSREEGKTTPGGYR